LAAVHLATPQSSYLSTYAGLKEIQTAWSRENQAAAFFGISITLRQIFLQEILKLASWFEEMRVIGRAAIKVSDYR
jgi:hypothetical protein